jgi:hypothetical protein
VLLAGFSGIQRKLLPKVRVLDEGFDPGKQFFLCWKLLAGTIVQEELDNVGKIFGIGAKACSHSIRARLDHVLASSVPKATTNKSDIGKPPPPTKLAYGITQEYFPFADDVVWTHLASPYRAEARRFHEFGDLFKSLGVSWNQNQL